MESSNDTTTNSIDVESPAETSDSINSTQEHENEHDSGNESGGDAQNDGTQEQQNQNDSHDTTTSTCRLLVKPLVVIFIMAPLAIVIGVMTGGFVGPISAWAWFATVLLCVTACLGSNDSSSHGMIEQQALPRRSNHSVARVRLSKEKMMELLIPVQEPHRIHDNEEWCCEVCLNEDQEVNGKVVASPNPECTHMFHRDCIIQWLELHDTCPCCRAEYLPTTVEEEGEDSSLHDVESGGDDHHIEQGDGGDAELAHEEDDDSSLDVVERGGDDHRIEQANVGDAELTAVVH